MCGCKWKRECIKPFVCTTITEDCETFFAPRDARVMTGVSTCRTLREFTHIFLIIVALQSHRPIIIMMKKHRLIYEYYSDIRKMLLSVYLDIQNIYLLNIRKYCKQIFRLIFYKYYFVLRMGL